jgi:hypothetical protein
MGGDKMSQPYVVVDFKQPTICNADGSPFSTWTREEQDTFVSKVNANDGLMATLRKIAAIYDEWHDFAIASAAMEEMADIAKAALAAVEEAQ